MSNDVCIRSFQYPWVFFFVTYVIYISNSNCGKAPALRMAHTFLRGKSCICDGTRIWFMTWITPFVPTASRNIISALLFKTSEFWKGNKNMFSVEPCEWVRLMPNFFGMVSPDHPFFAANGSFSFNKLPFAFSNSHHARKARV